MPASVNSAASPCRGWSCAGLGLERSRGRRGCPAQARPRWPPGPAGATSPGWRAQQALSPRRSGRTRAQRLRPLHLASAHLAPLPHRHRLLSLQTQSCDADRRFVVDAKPVRRRQPRRTCSPAPQFTRRVKRKIHGNRPERRSQSACIGLQASVCCVARLPPRPKPSHTRRGFAAPSGASGWS